MKSLRKSKYVLAFLAYVLDWCTAFGANTLVIDAGFSGSSIMQHLNERHSNLQGSNILKQRLSSFKDNPNYIFHNVNEEITHTLEIENKTKQRIGLILFANLPLSTLVVKEVNVHNEILESSDHYSRENFSRGIMPFVNLKVSPGKNRYLIITSTNGSIGAAQLSVKTEKEFSLFEKEVLIYISLVFGAVASLLLYNIFLLSVNKNIYIFNFTMLCFSLGMVEAIITGANSVFNTSLFNNTQRFWPLFTNIAASFFGMYLKEANFSTLRFIGNRLFFVLILVTNIMSLGCVFFAEYIHYEVQILLVFLGVGISSLFPYLLGRYKVIDHAVFISSFPLIGTSIIFVLEITGVIQLDVDIVRIQLTSAVIFLLSLSIYTGNKTHKNRLEKVRLQEMITLGRNVQDLLLPKRLEGVSAEIRYLFAYEPFEGKMSGDWIKYWRTKNGNHQFLLGDVTGKGPQAALAVSIISTVVDRCIRLDNDAKTALIQINKTLFNLLKGNMGSTASAATIKPDGHLTLYNTAGIGWVIQEVKKNRHILGRSGILGQRSFVEIFETNIPPSSWVYIYTFSDGVCNGPRAVKHLSRHLQSICPGHLDSPSLRREVMRVSKVVGDPQDDKTFLFITSLVS